MALPFVLSCRFDQLLAKPRGFHCPGGPWVSRQNGSMLLTVNVQSRTRDSLRSRHTIAKQTSAKYSTPPVLANIAAIFAKQLPLVAWPPPLLWEHSSQWFYPSPLDSSHSDAGHAWVQPPGNGSPLVRRYGTFPTAFRRWRSLPDVPSHPAAVRVVSRTRVRRHCTTDFHVVLGACDLSFSNSNEQSSPHRPHADLAQECISVGRKGTTTRDSERSREVWRDGGAFWIRRVRNRRRSE
jgi:hypothetical protein